MTVLRANIAFAKSRFEFAISFQFNNFHAPVNFLNSLQGKENGIRGNGHTCLEMSNMQPQAEFI